MTNDHEDELEEQLKQAARGLGVAAAERLDVEGTAAAVIDRLRREPSRRGARWLPAAWWRVAAVLVLLAGAAVVVRARFFPRDAAIQPQFLSDDLQGLSTEQLQEVLSTLDQTLADPTPLAPAEPDWDDLTTEQLQAVLRSLEG